MFGGPNPTGNIQDGVNPRRCRLEVDGTLWEVIDFFAEYEFLGNTFNTDPTVSANAKNVTDAPGPTDVWATITHLPIIGNFRVGSMKPPIGFEHLTSSRWLNFMERSFGFDAFLGGTNNGFLPGVQIFNWSKNENWTWQLGVFKNNQTVFGWNVGGGEYDTTGRITWTPVYEDNARKLVHLGLGTSVRGLDDGAARLRARTLLRNGPFTLQTRLLDINALGGSSQVVVVPEFAMNYGPFTIQAEYMASWITDTTNPATSTKNLGTTYYQDAYVEALLFLTGEHRPYLRHGWSGAAFDRVIPNRNFFWVPGNHCNPFSMGAWQVGVRYDWINFNNQAVNGGCLNDITLGLNWFLNPNMKFQWNYSMTYRQSPGDTNNGWVQGLGVRFAMDF
jgi:phosphate-selective porin OprO/OprP